MSFYDDASLIMFPSGYKEDKIYSLKPTDGSGDLTFTRASTATRVNAEGLIETASVISPTELVTNGDFATDTGWTKGTGVTISGGSLNFSGVLSSVNTYQSSSIEIGKRYLVTFTISNYTSGGIRAIIGSSGFTDIRTSNGTFTTDVVASGNTTIYLQSQSGTSTYSIDNVSVKEVIENNVPRIDYTGGGCGKLLLESQRTNYFTYSEELQTGTGGTLTVTPNTTISPDGTQNADSLGAGYLTKSLSATAGTWTFSTFAKYLSANTVQLYIYDGVYYDATFNVSTGVVTSSSAGVTASIQNMGNGWYRCIMTTTTANNVSEVGFSSGNVYAWGCQFE